MPSSSTTTALSTALTAALPFLNNDLTTISPTLLAVLRAVGAPECWHKHGTFHAHLVSVHNTLRLWGTPSSISLCGLFHSAYSNSYVNLAIFDAAKSRAEVAEMIGAEAERLVYLFCVVPRQRIVHEDLLFRFGGDGEVRECRRASEVAVEKARKGEGTDGREKWRRMVVEIMPPEGVTVKHIKTGEVIY